MSPQYNQPRPRICRLRGCYIKPKTLFPEWDKLQVKCNECPYTEIQETCRAFVLGLMEGLDDVRANNAFGDGLRHKREHGIPL